MSELSGMLLTFDSETSPYPNSIIEPLSERELEVLRWLASGASNREIGEFLSISQGTVKKHIYNIFGKLNVHNRTQATLQALELGIIPQAGRTLTLNPK